MLICTMFVYVHAEANNRHNFVIVAYVKILDTLTSEVFVVVVVVTLSKCVECRRKDLIGTTRQLDQTVSKMPRLVGCLSQ